MSGVEFLDKLLDGVEVEWKPLGMVAEYVRGLVYNKSSESSDGHGYKVLRANNITLASNQLNFDDIKVVNFDTKVKNTQRLHKNDILISAASGSREHVGKVAFIDADIDFYFGGFMGVVRCGNGLNSRYMFHVLTSDIFQKYLDEMLNSSTINNLNSTVMGEFKIPIPCPDNPKKSLEIQAEIVRILDAFNKLTTELTTELTTRKKQYNHYRDQLLSFEDGEVEWKTLGEVTQYEQPTKYLVAAANYSDEFETPVLTAGKTFILGYTDERDGIYKASESPVIIFDDFTTANKWVDFDFKAKSSAMKMITSSDESRVLLKYIFYWLNTLPSELVDGDHKRQWISTFAEKRIPIPSFAAQSRIVATLDKFDALTNSLTEGLPREIELRQKQYEHYRDLLLSFPRLEGEMA